ncbi:GNAT family N-acetyltransferase [Planctomycetota bacterium]
MLIRAATNDDCQTLADFNGALASETEDHALDAGVVLSGVRRGLELAPDVQYYVAEVDREVIGQLMVTREWSDWRDGWIWWIQSVYVQADHRGSGVFRNLLQHVTDFAVAESDVVGIRLYVENANERAQEVYARSGFVDPNYRVLERIFDA